MDDIELQTLNNTIRNLCNNHELEKCRTLICKAMGQYPDATQPHNLLGIVLEKQGNHLSAMKHFRAAWALDPTYLPASQNLNTFGTFHPAGPFAFDDKDVLSESAEAGPFIKKERSLWQESDKKIEYDADGIGHVVRRTEKWKRKAKVIP